MENSSVLGGEMVALDASQLITVADVMQYDAYQVTGM